jgi:rod shape-determining protein MreD
MACVIFAATLLQSLAPPVEWLGHAKAPCLLAVPVYYALARPRRLMLAAAVGAGLMQDALSMLPLGCSVLCFSAAGLLIHRFRETIAADSLLLASLLGLAAAGAVTLATGGILLLDEESGFAFRPAWLAIRVLGAAVLGAAAVPILVRGIGVLEQLVGLVPRPEKRRTWRTGIHIGN